MLARWPLDQHRNNNNNNNNNRTSKRNVLKRGEEICKLWWGVLAHDLEGAALKYNGGGRLQLKLVYYKEILKSSTYLGTKVQKRWKMKVHLRLLLL